MSSPAPPAGPEGVLSASFNQDFSCVAVATCRGFKIYSFDAGAWVYEDAMGAVRIVEMLHTSSLLAVVGAGDAPDLSPRRVKVLNTSTHACIADLAFTSTVLAVRLNRACLVVVEERRAVVHDLTTLAVQRVIDTPPNPRGVVALASDPDASALASATRDAVALAIEQSKAFASYAVKRALFDAARTVDARRSDEADDAMHTDAHA